MVDKNKSQIVTQSCRYYGLVITGFICSYQNLVTSTCLEKSTDSVFQAGVLKPISGLCSHFIVNHFEKETIENNKVHCLW